jgi:hypothetical protein
MVELYTLHLYGNRRELACYAFKKLFILAHVFIFRKTVEREAINLYLSR